VNRDLSGEKHSFSYSHGFLDLLIGSGLCLAFSKKRSEQGSFGASDSTPRAETILLLQILRTAATAFIGDLSL
jgi:hypothetical protein